MTSSLSTIAVTAAPRRIMLIGNIGTGKSTLARALGAALDLEVVHLDRMLWRPGWELTPEDEFRAQHQAVLDRASWIIDGVAYWSTVEPRVRASDLVIFLHYDIAVCRAWTANRQVEYMGRARPDLSEGCPEDAVKDRMFEALEQTQRETVPRIVELLARYRDGKPIFHLTAPDQLPGLWAELQPFVTARPAPPAPTGARGDA